MKYDCSYCDIIVDEEDKVQLEFCRSHSHDLLPKPENSFVTQSASAANKSQTSKNKKQITKTKGFIDSRFYVESVLVDGKPRFLAKQLTDNEIIIKDAIEVDDSTVYPLEANEYGYKPYSFTSAEVIDLINEAIKKENLLDEIKKQIDRYIVARELDKHLILGDILLTYCLEWVQTLHFPYFVGENESGKSSVCHLGKWLNYRAMYGEDIPHADIYNFLGTSEEGVGTIIEDEAQELTVDKEKLRTYKNSYSKGSVKPRIIMTQQKKQQVYYKIFGPKWFAGEKVPQDKGLRERLAIVYMTEGIPKSNIKRLTKEEEEQLRHLRNQLLIWKLQMIQQPFEMVASGLDGRDQELWEDFLSVVNRTKYYERCKEVVTYYTGQRHDVIRNSLEARIFKIIKQLLDGNLELGLESFWHHLVNDQDELAGTLEKETFYPYDYSLKITRNFLSHLFEDKFQAKRKRLYKIEDGKKHLVTIYQFKADVIEVLTKKYNIKNGDEAGNSRPNSSGRSGGSGKLFEAQADHVDHVDHLNDVSDKQNDRTDQEQLIPKTDSDSTLNEVQK